MAGLGILGGTFNPIHHAHLFLGLEAMAAYELERVLLVPNSVPPHRHDRVAETRHRFQMVCLAAAARSEFEASPVECQREGTTYSVDTVRLLREQHPGKALTFITGADSLLRYPWKDLDGLLGMLERFVVATRPGFDLAELERHLDEFRLVHRERIVELKMPLLEISATDIRRRVAEGRPIGYLVPSVVEDYIKAQGLFRQPRQARTTPAPPCG